MTGHPHAITGTLVGIGFYLLTRNGLIYILFCIIGSLAPDIDKENTVISIILLPISWTWDKVREIARKCRMTLLAEFLEHRGGATHSLIPLVTLLISYLCYQNMIIFTVMIGIYVHLLFDSFTSMGIPILFPFSYKKYRFLSVMILLIFAVVTVWIIAPEWCGWVIIINLF